MINFRDKAIHSDMKVSHRGSTAEKEGVALPSDFICGLSQSVMQDPVVIASGQTFERASIQAWFDQGNTCCPITQQPLADLSLIPNLSLKALISSWFHSPEINTRLNHGCEAIGQNVSDLRINHGREAISENASDLALEDTDGNVLSRNTSDGSCCGCLDEEEGNGDASTVSIGSVQRRAAEYFRCTEALDDQSGELIRQKSDEVTRQRSGEILLRHRSDPTASGDIGCILQGEGIHSGNAVSSVDASSMPMSLHHSFGSNREFLSITFLVTLLRSEVQQMQMKAVAQLRLLAKDDAKNRCAMVEAGVLQPLITILHSTTDVALEKDSTTTVLNLSISPHVRPHIIDSGAITPLVKIVKQGLTNEAMENAALALSNLASTDEAKAKIGSAGAVPHLVELLETGTERGRKDAATALFSLSTTDENKRRIVRAGASKLLINFISLKTKGMMDKALAIVANLVTVEEGRVALVAEGGTSVMLDVIQGSGSRLGKELAISTLLVLCKNSLKHRSLILQKDPFPALIALSESGNSKTKAKAAELFHLLSEQLSRQTKKVVQFS